MKKRKIFLGLAALLGIIALGLLGMLIATDPGDNISMEEHGVKTGQAGNRLFAGSIKNRTDHQSSNVQVRIGFFKEDGASLVSEYISTESLGPGQVWNFEVPLAEGATRFRIEEMRWRDNRRDRDYNFGPYKLRDIYKK